MELNYYQVLGIRPGAAQEEVRRAYRFLAMAFHPDRYLDPAQKARAEAHFKVIQEAYAILSDPRKRRAHDAAHRAEPAPLPRPGSRESPLIKAGTLRRGPFSIPSAGKNSEVLTAMWASLWTQYDPKTSGKETGSGLSVGNHEKKWPL